MSFEKRFPKNDKIWKYSNPRIAQKMAHKYFGKTAKIFRSKTKDRKYCIVNNKGNGVNFGLIGYEDYTKHKNKSRRKNYLTRSARIKGNWRENKYSPNNLSRKILW